MLKFSERERDVLRMRLLYGMPLRDVAAKLRATREPIRQIEARAIRKMKCAFGGQGYIDADRPVLVAMYHRVFDDGRQRSLEVVLRKLCGSAGKYKRKIPVGEKWKTHNRQVKTP